MDLLRVIGSPSMELLFFVKCTEEYTMQFTVHYLVQCRLECQVLFSGGKKGGLFLSIFQARFVVIYTLFWVEEVPLKMKCHRRR